MNLPHNKAIVAVGFWLAVAILIGIGVDTHQSTVRLLATSGRVARVRDVTDNLQEILFNLQEAEVQTRELIRSDDLTHEQERLRAASHINTALQHLRAITADTIKESQDIEALGFLASDRLALLDEVVQTRNSHDAETALQFLDSDRSRAMMDSIRATFDRLTDNERKALLKRDDELKIKAETSVALFVVGCFLSLAILLCVFLYLNVQIAARQLAEAALDHEKRLLEQQYSRQATLAQIELAINQPHELETVLERITRAVSELLPTDSASVILWDARTEEFIGGTKTLAGQPPQTAQDRAGGRDRATRWIIEHKQILVVPDVGNDPDGNNRIFAEQGFRSYVGLPLLVEGEALGVLYALDRKIRGIRDDEMELLQSLATRAALAISKVRLYDKLQDVNRLLETHVRERTSELIFTNERLLHEIEEHRRDEQALRESEERFRQLAEGTTQVFWFTELKPERVLYVSPAFEKIWGYPCQQLLEQPRLWVDAIIPEDRARVHDAFESWILGKAPEYDIEFCIRNQAGEIHWIRDRGTATRNAQGEIYRVSGIADDITDRKLNETALRESEERYRDVIEGAYDMVQIVAPDGRVLSANRAWLTNLGYTEADLPTLSIFDVVHGESTAHFQEIFTRLLEGESARQIEAQFLTKDHRIIEVEGNATVLTRNGQVAAVHGFFRDITARRHAEQALHELSGRLLQLQDQERRHIARELHDVTAQNLSAITLNLARIEKLVPTANAKARQVITESLNLAEECLREIRTLSYVLHPPMLDEYGLPRALEWYLEGFTKRSGIHVELQTQSQLGRLSDEAEMALFRIVQESLTNIRRHSGSRNASIQLTRDDGIVTLQIEDDGKGFREPIGPIEPPAAIDLGVGITGMRERLRQLGGQLEIASSSKGTTVRAIVPIKGEQA